MKKIITTLIISLLICAQMLPVYAATADPNDDLDNQTVTNAAPNTVSSKNKPTSNTSTDTADFKLHTGYHDMFMHYDRFLNMKVGEKTKIYIYIPEKLYEGAKVTEITNNFPDFVTYSGDGTVEALKSIGYGRCLKIHTTVYLPKEDRYEHFTTKIHTYN